jgi:hypothetical protein
MKWSQLGQNKVHTDWVSWKTISLLHFKAQISFVAGLGCWLGSASHWGHHLASLSPPKLENPME